MQALESEICVAEHEPGADASPAGAGHGNDISRGRRKERASPTARGR